MNSHARRAVVVVLALAALALCIAPATADAAGRVSRQAGIAQLQQTRRSIDRTLALIKSGKAPEAFAEARGGYLRHFEKVEIPLRVANPDLTIEAEATFAEIRTLIRQNAPVSKVRDKIIELRKTIDDAERSLTATGIGAPALVFGQAFLIIFREGFEIVLLLAVLFGYLESARQRRHMRPILVGVAIAAVATVLTVVALQTVFASLPVSREVLEALTALVAVALLFYVSFWLIARLEHKRWMEFLRARMWNAVSVGSTASLVLLGFTAVYREGFETALFYQALLSFGRGLGAWVALGILAGLVALAVVAYIMLGLGRRVPVRTFMNVAVSMVMVTSVAFLGNAVNALQAADVVRYTPLSGWPRLPIFLAQATGYWPTVQTVLAQSALAFVYLCGALYVFVYKPRRDRRLVERATRSVGSPVSTAVS